MIHDIVFSKMSKDILHNFILECVILKYFCKNCGLIWSQPANRDPSGWKNNEDLKEKTYPAGYIIDCPYCNSTNTEIKFLNIES